RIWPDGEVRPESGDDSCAGPAPVPSDRLGLPRTGADLPAAVGGARNPYREAALRAFKRRGWDSNPRAPVTALAVFKTAPFDRSGTPPVAILAAAFGNLRPGGCSRGRGATRG